MKRQDVRNFIKSGVNALSQSCMFNSGRISEFNSGRSNEYPFLWLESLRTSTTINENTTNPSEAWEVVIHIADKDAQDSLPEVYEPLIDGCDYIAQQLIRQLNIDLTYSDLIVIKNIEREPFIKKHADNTTGVILSFTLIDYRSTNVC